jgi:hypothetical protein
MQHSVETWFSRRRLERALPNPRSAKPTRPWHDTRSQRYWSDVRRAIFVRLILALILAALAVAVHNAPVPQPQILQHG